jgi:hypothetical protein
MNQHVPAAVVATGVAAIVAVWAAVPWASGWRQLARVYELRNEFEGEKRRFQSAWMRLGMRYGNCLTVGANRQGFYLASWPPFLPGHPPLFVPWGEIQARPWKSIWMRGTELRFRQVPSVPVRIRLSLAAWLRQAAGDAWPGEKGMSS